MEEPHIQARMYHEDTGKEAREYMTSVGSAAEQAAGSLRSSGSWEEEWENQENRRFGGEPQICPPCSPAA